MKKRLKKRIKRVLSFVQWKLNGNQTKIFCIGRNKTGTTSLKSVLESNRFYVGDQKKAELLVHEYARKNWDPILSYCKSAQAFQDAPFSWPDTWKILAKKYPDAKFILTSRDSILWYNSLCRFHTNLFSTDKSSTPTKEDLQRATYRYKGFMWDANRAVWATPENDLYNKEMLISNYEKHNAEVREYFKGSQNFLDIDVSAPGSLLKLCNFLGLQASEGADFPHLNNSKK